MSSNYALMRIAENRGIYDDASKDLLELHAKQTVLTLPKGSMEFIVRGQTDNAEASVRRITHYLADAMLYCVKAEISHAAQMPCHPDEMILGQYAINALHEKVVVLVYKLLLDAAKANKLDEMDVMWMVYDEASDRIPVEPRKKRGEGK